MCASRQSINRLVAPSIPDDFALCLARSVVDSRALLMRDAGVADAKGRMHLGRSRRIPGSAPASEERMSTSASYDAAGIRQGIDETNAGFMEAFGRGDPAAAVRDTYTRDARILPPGAPLVQGRDGIAQFWTGAAAQLGIKRVELSTVDLQPLGDGAYEVGRGTLTLGSGQQVVAKYVVIWRHEDGRCRWHVDIWNMEAA
jgi:ketosteroid isomerase-like protein